MPDSFGSLPAVFFDGQWRMLGQIPSDDNHYIPDWREKVSFAASFPLQEIDLSFLANRVMDQSTTSSCVGHGAAAGMEIAWRQQGNAPVNFAPYFIYGLINHGRDQGAMISDALMALKNTGVCPLEDLPSGIMYQQQFPQQALQNAGKYKLLMAYKCSTYDDICQAINVGFTVPLGLMVGTNFANVDSEGVCPLPAGGGGGHCVLGCGLKQSQKYGWLIKIQNSWGLRFGNKGFAYLQRQHIGGRMPPDAFAIQAPSGNNPPPVIN